VYGTWDVGTLAGMARERAVVGARSHAERAEPIDQLQATGGDQQSPIARLGARVRELEE
jgi:hypothetical protein